jgi:hypothetical protein
MNTQRYNELAKIGAAFEAGLSFGNTNINERNMIDSLEEDNKEIFHQIPSINIMIDGVQTDPEKIKEFDGTPLYYVADDHTINDKVLNVFTSVNLKEKYFSNIGQSTNNNNGIEMREHGPELGGYVELSEHKDYGGARWFFDVRWGNIPKFSCVYPTLWWCTNINDKVSSVDTNVKKLHSPFPGHIDPATGTVVPYPKTILYEHENYGGSQLTLINAVGLYPHLGNYGWNDRASSMSYSL